MAEENVMAEVMNLLEVEPAAALPAPGPDIPALRENLAFSRPCVEIAKNIRMTMSTT